MPSMLKSCTLLDENDCCPTGGGYFRAPLFLRPGVKHKLNVATVAFRPVGHDQPVFDFQDNLMLILGVEVWWVSS